jgi:hypothetical protein
MFLDNTEDLVILDYFVTTNLHSAKFYSLLLQYRDKDDNLCVGIFAEEMPTIEWQKWFNETTERWSRNESLKLKVFFDTPKHYYSGFVKDIMSFLEKEGRLVDRRGQEIIW